MVSKLRICSALCISGSSTEHRYRNATTVLCKKARVWWPIHPKRNARTIGMKVNLLRTSLVMIFAVTGGYAQDWTSLWKSYAAKFMDNQVRVIDHDANDRTTSEGQAYAMFFSLVANDRDRFDGLVHWTELNLASGDLSAHLPAWSWGKALNGKWGILDSNSASDADVWIAYTLLQAGAAWDNAHYTWLGTALAKRIAAEETAQIPDFGTMLLPGANGFHNRQSYRLNASYLVLPLFIDLGRELPDGPWQQIAKKIPDVVRGSSPNGLVSDWTEYKPGTGLVPASLGSYDAIRVYLWAGMLDPDSRYRSAILQSLSGLARYLHTNPIPPAKIKPDGTVVDPKGPVGFSGALIPYLSALEEANLASEQISRLQSEFDSKTGLYGNPARYYDQNLILFALGWKTRQFWFDSQGRLQMAWHKN
jgi:endoglucanase